MNYADYFDLSSKRFPDNHYDKIPKATFNRVDLVRKNAECLFLDAEIDSALAAETRRQLYRLKTEGITRFDGE